MDRLQPQPCHKTFNNNEDQTISWNEKCDKVFSPSELNEFEKLVLWLDGADDNPYLHTRAEVGDGGPKPQQYKYRESKQRNSQLNSNFNANFEFVNTCNENAAFNLSFDPRFNAPQRGNPFDGLPLDCLTTMDLCSSEVKEEIVNYSFTSGISEPVYQSQSVVSKTVYTTLSTRHYMKTFTSTSHEQNKMQSFKSFSAASNEEYIATPDGGNRDTLFNNNTCAAESFEDIYKESFLRSSNISVSKSYSGNFGFTQRQKSEEIYEERQNQNKSRVDSQPYDNRHNGFTNKYEPFVSVNDVHNVANPTDMSSEAHRNPQDERLVCPFCGKSFHWKYKFDLHCRYHTGEKPYVSDKCEKRFVSNSLLTKHRVSHNEEKPFACNSCEKRFARKIDETRHLCTHPGGKRHKCSICGKAFSQSGNLNRHYKKIHNKK